MTARQESIDDNRHDQNAIDDAAAQAAAPTSETGQPAASGVRPRPQLHFTAESGWINDPYGLAWDGDTYHLYYQAIPGQVVWGPNCHWGHATSTSLVGWAEETLALVPQPFEVGCWSGSVVADVDPPTLFYTRVSGEDFEIGEAARAVRDASGSWLSSPDDVVVAGPPSGLGVRCFRDPNVFRHGDEWVMLMATALEGEVAAVLQYRSADLQTWSYDGILCSRASGEQSGAWTGSLWECPQLIQVDGHWVLLVSVWQDATLHYVAAAVGDYDGHRFTPTSWRRLTFGSSAYATAAFLDREGRASTLSWLREEPQNNPELAERAGAHSLPALLEVYKRNPARGHDQNPAASSDTDYGVRLRPHPDVDALAHAPVGPTPEPGQVCFSIADQPTLIDLGATAGAAVHVEEAGRRRFGLQVVSDGSLDITRPGFDAANLPGPGPFAVYLDADIVEIFGAEAYGAYRVLPSSVAGQNRILASIEAEIRVRILRRPPGSL